MREPTSPEDLKDTIDYYLGELAPVVPKSTYSSQKSTLNKLHQWDRITTVSDLCESSLADFTADLATEYAPTTVSGHVDTVSNFLGFHLEDDPDLVRYRIVEQLYAFGKEENSEQLKELAVRLRTPFPEIRLEYIEGLFSFLRQCRYGTREHLFAELIHDTKARPSQVLEVDSNHVDREEGTLEIGISENHVVRQAGLVETREASLSPFCLEVLHSYSEHERVESGNALLTTNNGRASESTLRRSIKSASKTTIDLIGESIAKQHVSCVTPVSIRRCAIHRRQYD